MNATGQTATSNSSLEDGEVSTTSAHHPLLAKLSCPICCDKFKNPKVLFCGHSFCSQCVNQVLGSSTPTCPQCRASVSVSSIDQLPTNFSLRTLVESDDHSFPEVSRGFRECTEHVKKCDKYCKTCEEQVCEDCVAEQHASDGDHETFPVGVVVAEQRELVDAVMKKLRAAEDTLRKKTENTAKSIKACKTDVIELLKQISASADGRRQGLSDEQESLKNSVEKEEEMVIRNLESIKGRCFELSMSLDHIHDLCFSSLKDLKENNISRASVIKSLALKAAKVSRFVDNLSKRKSADTISFIFQSQVNSSLLGKLVEGQSLLQKATHMKTVQLPEGKICGFVWPELNWLSCITCHTAEGGNKLVKFQSYHFLKDQFVHRIGVDKPWYSVIPEISNDAGLSMLCLGPKQIHIFKFPSANRVDEPGEIVNTVFLKNVMAIAWDEQRRGCYALLSDGYSLMHVDMGSTNRKREVAKLSENVSKMMDTHLLHVNREGNMAVCDHGNKVVYFYESMDEEQPKYIRAPPRRPGAVPLCVSSRNRDILWYVLWKVNGGVVHELHVYDSWFEHIGRVILRKYEEQPAQSLSDTSLTVTFGRRTVLASKGRVKGPVVQPAENNPEPENDSVSFSFQDEYVVVQINGKAYVYHLL